MIDYHCHILPDLDDGPKTMKESIEMATALSKAGFKTAYCTPHLIRGFYEASNEKVRKSVDNLQKELVEKNIDLELQPGREYYLDEFIFDYLNDPQPLGTSNNILIEIPNHIRPEQVKNIIYKIMCSGLTPVIAHPERCMLFDQAKKQTDGRFLFMNSLFKSSDSKRKTRNLKPEDNSLLSYLQEIDCRFQGNLGSFSSMYGKRVRQNAERFRQAERYTCFGTDAHSVKGLAELGDAVGVICSAQRSLI